MARRLDEHPEYRQLKALKQARGRELMQRYGAHAIGIGWGETKGGGRQPALLFYVERSDGAAADIPTTLTYRPPDGDEVELATEVVESPMAQLEAEEETESY